MFATQKNTIQNITDLLQQAGGLRHPMAYTLATDDTVSEYFTKIQYDF